MKLKLNNLSDFERPSPDQVRAHLKKATAKSSWINYIVILLSVYFVWNTGVAIRHNQKLQVKLDTLANKAQLLTEANKNLELQKSYYRSKEYQEKTLKDKFNLVSPGESVLIVKDLPAPKDTTNNIFSDLQELRRLINN